MVNDNEGARPARDSGQKKAWRQFAASLTHLAKRRLVVFVCVTAGVLLAIGLVFVLYSWRSGSDSIARQNENSPGTAQAIAVGKQLSHGSCSGTGSTKLSVLPMKTADFAFIEPYGLMVGGHVTPIDHQYFTPTVFRSAQDTYEVRAMGDAKIVDLEVHPTRIRLVFSVSCTFFYYYDLLTSVEPYINDKALPIDVKAGQLIGHIGGQTLDFAVWDTTRPLKGFIVPDHYRAEPWKLYTADPLDYYTDSIKQAALAKYVRTAAPRSGKIDYDIDGKLIGNWFQIGTNGYGGVAGEGDHAYWQGHLSFAPNLYDPTSYIASVGYLAPASGAADNQFALQKDSPDPATVSKETGLVKYELKTWTYSKSDGSDWDSMAYTSGVTVSPKSSKGCALVQMTGARSLKFETFIGADCSAVNGFNNPKTYER